MKSKLIRLAVLPIAALALVGCAAALQGFPDRVADTKKELKALEPFMSSDAIKNYKKKKAAEKQLIRDEYVNARIHAMNLHFGEFEKALFRQGVGFGIATDWLKLALGAAGTLYSGASQALSAAVTGIEGAKAAFDKQAFFENTITTLLTTMVANRKTVEVRIREGLATPVEQYTLTNAMADLEDYYIAGTIPGALVSITEDSGAKAAQATGDLKEIKFKRTVAFATDIVQDRVNAILVKIDALEPAKALELSENPPVPLVVGSDAANLINLVFPVRPLTNPDDARELLGMMVGMGDRTNEILEAWDNAL